MGYIIDLSGIKGVYTSIVVKIEKMFKTTEIIKVEGDKKNENILEISENISEVENIVIPTIFEIGEAEEVVIPVITETEQFIIDAKQRVENEELRIISERFKAKYGIEKPDLNQKYIVNGVSYTRQDLINDGRTKALLEFKKQPDRWVYYHKMIMLYKEEFIKETNISNYNFCYHYLILFFNTSQVVKSDKCPNYIYYFKGNILYAEYDILNKVFYYDHKIHKYLNLEFSAEDWMIEFIIKDVANRELKLNVDSLKYYIYPVTDFWKLELIK